MPIGFTLLGFVGLLLAENFSFTKSTIIVSGFASLLPVLLLFKRRERQAFSQEIQNSSAHWMAAFTDRYCFARWIFFIVILLAVCAVFERALIVTSDGVVTGIDHNIGDLPLHIGVVESFVKGHNFPPEHVEFAGARLTYPFMADFVAAIFVMTGASLRKAFLLENLALALALLSLLYHWALALTRHRLAACATILIVLLSGGLGGLSLFHEAWSTERGLFPLLMNLPHDYTMAPGLRWGNLLTTMLVTQRSLLLGIPLFLIVWTLWIESLWHRHLAHKERRIMMIAAGLLVGCLPLVHTYSFLVAMGVGSCLFLLYLKDWRGWFLFFTGAALLGLPQIWRLLIKSSVQPGNYLSFHFGWDSDGENIIFFWVHNTGLLIPLSLLALFWRGRRPLLTRDQIRMFFAFTLCFIIPNLFRLAPWIWDNIKIMIYWQIVSACLTSLCLLKFYNARRTILTATSLLLFATLIFSGSLDIWRVISRATTQVVFADASIEAAKMIEELTPKRALILSAPDYNQPVLLTGRRSVMGYPGHLLSYGIDYQTRMDDVRKIFQGTAQATSLIDHYQIDYVLIEPRESELFFSNESFFQNYQLVGERCGYRLYRVR